MCNMKRVFLGMGKGLVFLFCFVCLVGFFTSEIIYGCFAVLEFRGVKAYCIAYFGNDALLLPVYRAGQNKVKELGTGCGRSL